MSREKATGPTLFFFFLVVASAAIFRLTNLNTIEFKADEAINLFLASRPLFGHPFPPGGTVSSIGLLNPPLFNYILFPFVSISLDPKTISFFIGLVNSLSIGFFFLLIKRYYNLTIALIASLLFAFSPWAILFSRKIWTQDLILPFFIILLFCLHQILFEKKMIYWFPYIVSSLFLLQLHQSTLFILLLINAFLLTKKPRFHPAYIILGLILGLLPMAPYLAYIIKNISTDPSAFLVAKQRFGTQFFPIIFFRPMQIISQGNFHFILGDDILTFANHYPLIFRLRKLLYLEYLLLPFGAFLFWKKYPQSRFLTYTTVGLPCIYFLLRFEPFMHYFIILTPLLFLFLANFFSYALRLPNPAIRLASFFVFTSLIAVSIAYNAAFFNLLNGKKALKGDYGTAFETIEQNTKKRFQAYQNDGAYQEMLLADFLPKNLFYGYLPLGKMIYPTNETRNNLLLLEERLKTVPGDARIQNELLAFYTQKPPTAETVSLLREKSDNIPGYQPVFEEVNRLFRTRQH